MIFLPVAVAIFLTSGVLRLLPLKKFFSPKFFPIDGDVPADIPGIFKIFTAIFSAISFSLFAFFGAKILPFLPDFFSENFEKIVAGFLILVAIEKIIFAIRRPKMPAPQNSFFAFFAFFSAGLFVIFAAKNFSIFEIFAGIFLGSAAIFGVLKYGEKLFEKYGAREIWLFEGLSAIPIFFLAGQIFF